MPPRPADPDPPATAAARPDAEATRFELERFAADDQAGGWTVLGRWFGVRGRIFIRPELTFSGDGQRRRVLADLEEKPWQAVEGEEWRVTFPDEADLDEGATVELTVAPDITVAIHNGPPGSADATDDAVRPAPAAARARSKAATNAGRSRNPATTGAARRAKPADPARARPAGTPKRPGLAVQLEAARQELEAANQELGTLRAERDALAGQVATVTEQVAAVAGQHAAVAEREAAVQRREAALLEAERRLGAMVEDLDSAPPTPPVPTVAEDAHPPANRTVSDPRTRAAALGALTVGLLGLLAIIISAVG